jgi:ubiquinol-cytochrome c reductase cytochrome c subunit
MKTIRPLALILAFALPAAAQAPATAVPPPKPDPQSAARGKTIFEQVGCYQCHGRVGQGSMMTGPSLAPNPAPLVYFQTYVRAPRGQMPPYARAILSDDQLSDIHAFLRSIPPGKAAASIPLLAHSAMGDAAPR